MACDRSGVEWSGVASDFYLAPFLAQVSRLFPRKIKPIKKNLMFEATN